MCGHFLAQQFTVALQGKFLFLHCLLKIALFYYSDNRKIHFENIVERIKRIKLNLNIVSSQFLIPILVRNKKRIR